VAVAGFSLYWWVTYQPVPVVSSPEVLDRGLELPPVSASPRGGYWRFLGTPEAAAFGLSETEARASAFPANTEYVVRTQSGQFAPAATIPTTEAYRYVIDETAAADGPEARHPALVANVSGTTTRLATPSGWYESYPRANPFATDQTVPPLVAYSYYQGPTDDAAAQADIANWSVVVHDPVAGRTTEITAAVSPRWFNGGADVAFVRRNGIYRYNFATQTEVPVVTNWSALPADTQLAVARNSQAMVMTIPALNAIAVYTLLTSDGSRLREQGIISTSDAQFVDPVFSPDGRQYAVVRRSAQEPSERITVVVRETRSRQPVVVVEVPLSGGNTDTLIDWQLR